MYYKSPRTSIQKQQAMCFIDVFQYQFLDWPGGSDVRIIHGRPRHSQSQVLVERGHQLMLERLATAEAEWLETHQSPFLWHERLPVIQCKFPVLFIRFVYFYLFIYFFLV